MREERTRERTHHKDGTRFPWGDEATDGRVFAASRVDRRRHDARDQEHGGERPAAELGVGLSTPGVRRCVLASLGWVLMMLNSYGLQVFLRLGKQNFSSKALARSAIVYNSLEHAPAFLMLMWLHCILVDADQAGYLGMVYVAHRFVYGIFFGDGAVHFPVRVMHPAWVCGDLLLWFLALDGVLSGALLSIPVVLARQPVYIGSGSNAREYAAVQHSVGLSNRISER